jgi:hypothetical protein
VTLCALPIASALPERASITVSATVLKRAFLDVRGEPANLVLTEADVARGFVDAPLGTIVEVRSNSPEGVMVRFVAESELVSGVQGGPFKLPGAPRGASLHVFAPSYRLLLSPAARPGVYPWPARISVTPL